MCVSKSVKQWRSGAANGVLWHLPKTDHDAAIEQFLEDASRKLGKKLTEAILRAKIARAKQGGLKGTQ
jgi:hypothetical protein